MTEPVVLDDYSQELLANQTVIANGSAVINDLGHKEVSIVVNVKGPVTGTLPTLQFTLQEVDPGDLTTALGTSATGAQLTGVGTQIVTLPVTLGGAVKVSWVVGGTTPSFGGVYATLVNKGPFPGIYDAAGHGPVAVKPASTAVVAADPALAVGLHPSSPLPAGSNLVGQVEVTDGTNVLGTAAHPVRTDPTGTTTQPVSGTVTANQGTAAAVGGAWPVEVTDGTNVLGTAAHPVRTDPTGTTTQPVSGTVTAQQSVAGNLLATVTQGPGSGVAGTYWYVRVTDGTNAMPTMDTAGRAGFQHITDGTNTAAVKAASTAAAAADPSLVIALSPNSPLPAGTNDIGKVDQGTPNTIANKWPVQLTDGTNTQPTGDAAARSIFTQISDGTHGPAAVKPASTAAAATDPALVVAISPNNTIAVGGVADATATGALGALNAAVTLTTAGLKSVGFQLAAGTLIGTIVAEVSFDGGTTWNATYFDQNNKLSSIVFASANTAQAGTIVGEGGAGQFRVRVSAYTSGTANITLRASQIDDPTVEFTGLPGAAVQPPTVAQVGGWDGANLRAMSTDSSGRPKTNAFISSPNAQAAGLYAFINPYGTLRVSPEAMAVFIDNFNGNTIDTTNWATPVTSGGGTVTQTSGILTLAVGTTGGAYATIATNPTFYQDGLGFLIHGSLMKMEAATVAGTYRFWGQGTLPATPAVGTPIYDGIGFEIDTSGNLNCVIWQAGTKVFSQNITKPTDGAWHRYGYFTRPDTTIWYVDSLETPVATFSQAGLTSNVGPSTTALPVLKALFNPASAPGSAPTFQFQAVALADSSNSAVQIADGNYPWRNATINSQGQLSVTSTPTASTAGISPGYVTTSAKTNVPLYASTYNEQSSNFTGSIVSSSAADAAAGTGARTVTIYWMNAAGTTIGTETVTLNGTTAVNLVTSTKCFIEKIVVATVGSGGANAGTITLFTGTGGTGTAVAIVNAGDNQTFLGHHYVVSGKSCYVTDMTGTTSSSNQTLFSLRSVNIPVAGLPSIQVSDWINGSQTSQIQRTYSSQIVIAGPARLRMYAAPGATATLTSYGSFDYYDQ
jgi:hypothetical protein